jgi:hypothetical protein
VTEVERQWALEALRAMTPEEQKSVLYAFNPGLR